MLYLTDCFLKLTDKMSELIKPTRQLTNCLIFKVVTWKDVCIFLEMKVASCTLSPIDFSNTFPS